MVFQTVFCIFTLFSYVCLTLSETGPCGFPESGIVLNSGFFSEHWSRKLKDPPPTRVNSTRRFPHAQPALWPGKSRKLVLPIFRISRNFKNVTILPCLSNSADPFFLVRNSHNSGPSSASLRNFFSFFQSTRGESSFFPACFTSCVDTKKNGISVFSDSDGHKIGSLKR